MKAIVIIYDGTVPTQYEAEQIIKAATFIKGNGSITPFEEDSIAGLIAKSCIPPKFHVEDGNSAVITIAEVCDLSREPYKFATSVIFNLTNKEFKKTENGKAFVKACSLLSKSDNEVPVDPRVANEYGFNAAHRDCIRTLYKHYLEGDYYV